MWAMLPRAISRLPSGIIRSRPFSTHRTFWPSATPAVLPPPRRRESDCSVRQGLQTGSTSRPDRAPVPRPNTSARTPPFAIPGGERRRGHTLRRRFSAEVAPAPGEENGPPDDSDGDSSGPLPAAGLRPATATASTPTDLGCKAYYMARTIDIKTVCKVRYSPSSRSCAVLFSRRPSGEAIDHHEPSVHHSAASAEVTTRRVASLPLMIRKGASSAQQPKIKVGG